MELDSSFEDDLHEAALDNVEQAVREEYLPTLEQYITERLEQYGQRHDYNVDVLIAAMETDVERDDGRVKAVVRLPHPAYLFETGTVAHTIEAKNADVLSFIWERRHDPPQWVRDEYEREGDGWRVFLPKVEVSGLPEGRFIRDALHDIRRVLP